MLLPTCLCAGDQRPERRAALGTLTSFAGADSTADAIKCGLPSISRALGGRGSVPQKVTDALNLVLARPVMHVSKTSGRFRVHYDTTGTDAAALLDPLGQRLVGSAHVFADSALSILGRVEEVEAGQLGYPAPQADGNLGGGPEYDVYIMELGNLYGYTTPDRSVPEGDTASTFITIDNDFRFVSPDQNKGLPALRVTIAHEYHHAVQIGRFGYWTQDVFFYEITSTWLEDVVYTEVNDYYNYLRASWGHFRNPDRPFFSGSDLIMYSRGIWGQFVTRRFGITAMRRCWELVRGARPALAIDRALGEYGSSLSAAIAEWTLWNYFTAQRSIPALYYEEGESFPLLTETPAGFVPPVREVPGSLAPLAARYYEVPLGGDTLCVVVANLDYPLALQNSNIVPYTLFLANSRLDEAYRPTATSLFMKLSVVSPPTWGLWSILRGDIRGGSGTVLSEGTAYPNPFRTDGTSFLLIPVDSPVPLSGTVNVFTAGMDRIRTFTTTSRAEVGRQVFSWDGRADDGPLANSGIYIVVVTTADRTITSKVAVLRAR